MPIKVGFLIGKARVGSHVLVLCVMIGNIWCSSTHICIFRQDTDLVEDGKYVGDASFLADMPDKQLGIPKL